MNILATVDDKENVGWKNAINVDDAVCLYAGKVMHARMKPFNHRFNYRVFNLFIDLTKLNEANRFSSLFSVNRFNILSFHEKDHGDGSNTPLFEQIERSLAESGVTRSVTKIQLLCYPRVLGYVFNPISVYYCQSGDELVAMVYEVRNTFGGIHTYVEPIKEHQITRASLKQETLKVFHVSPFLDMSMRYFFRVNPVGDKMTFRILETDAEGPILAATLNAVRTKLNSANVLFQLAKSCLLTTKVMAAIHFEALKLWLKGAKYHPNPHSKNTDMNE